MSPLNYLRFASWQRTAFIVGVCAAALLLPSLSRADDPVEELRKALKIEPTSPVPKVIGARNKKIEFAIQEMKTISHRRRAYFLTEWLQYFELENNVVRKKMEAYRTAIGKDLQDAIIQAAQVQSDDNRLAVATLIAETAEADKKIDSRGNPGKFARTLTPVVADLMKANDDAVRQAALNALGKMTPDPKVAIPIIEQTLKGARAGPRRLAAYALVDLVKYSQHHQRAEELQLLKHVIRTATEGLRDAGDTEPMPDELTRGYCLQAIQESARTVMGKFSSAPALFEEDDPKRKPMAKDQAEILTEYQAANKVLVASLADPRIKIRLATLKALEEISTARSKITLNFEGPDPLEDIIKGGWKAIARLLKEEDPHDTPHEKLLLRRGAISFFEQLGPQAAPAVEIIVQALRDEDRFVKWTAMRAIQNLSKENESRKRVGSQAIFALAYNLLIDGDHDLSGAAAETIESLGPDAQEAVHALGIVIGNGGADNRSWDVENRVKAMAALVSVGTPRAETKKDDRAGIKAKVHTVLPQLLSALSDPDVRIRQKAAQTIGDLGRPDDDQIRQRLLVDLRKALGDSDEGVRSSASEAIIILSAAPKN